MRELNLSGIPTRSATGPTTTSSTPTATAWSPRTATPATADGKPTFFESDLPPTGLLDVTQPRIYFGENSPQYSIVGAPAGTTPGELDYPDDERRAGQANNTYAGNGGVPIGSPFNRLLYAVKFQEPNILLSDLVNDDSQDPLRPRPRASGSRRSRRG